jgi:hypothetical protein
VSDLAEYLDEAKTEIRVMADDLNTDVETTAVTLVAAFIATATSLLGPVVQPFMLAVADVADKLFEAQGIEDPPEA